MRRISRHCLVLIVTACSFISGFSSAPERNFDKEESAVVMRQAHMELIAAYFGQIAAMVKGKQPYNAELFIEDTAKIAQLSVWANDGFSRNMTTGESTAKPEIWKNKADFDALMKEFAANANALHNIAQKKDLKLAEPAFKEVAASCKSCHKKYKS